MKPFAVVLLAISLGSVASANQTTSQAAGLEKRGDAKAALLLLQRAVQSSPDDVESLTAYARFLDLHRDPEARTAYERLLSALKSSPESAAPVARRLALLDLMANDTEAAGRHLAIYRASGQTDLALPPPRTTTDPPVSYIEIPGPLRSFARMSALSPDLFPSDVLSALARNVITSGYQASSSNEALEQTEFLKLVVRYLSQARELDKLAGASKAIKIDACESAQTADLLRVLGFRMRGGCGSEVVLETVNATRAFLTMDSGFPLAELEQALRTNRPFAYEYKPTRVPILYTPEYWISSREKATGEFIDIFLGDPSLCRLYLGFSKLDHETALALRKHMSAQRIRAFSHVLDFFGGMFKIRNGKAYVPGGRRAAAAWAELAGASPDQGAAFYEKLMFRDDGWLAGYYDAVARIAPGPVLDYISEPARLKRFYNALRGKVTSPGPARPVFRSNTDLMLLTSRLRVEPDGKPHIPGSLEIWKNLFINHPHGKYDGKLTKAAVGWKEPDDLLEALFALSRKAVENEPLRIYMALSDMNRRRIQPLEPATVDRLARAYRFYGSQYSVLAESATVSGRTIVQYIDLMTEIDDIGNQGTRADIAGSLQALVGLWQIFNRQKLIPPDKSDAALSEIVTGFTKIKDSTALFDASRAGVKVLLAATGSDASASPQDRLLDLLAGAASPSDADSHQALVSDMMRVFEAQRLVSLKTLFDLADHIDSLARGEKMNPALIGRLSSRIAEIQLPRASLSTVEKNAMSFGYWTEKHVDQQRRVNIRALVERNKDPGKLKDARGLLAPFLRDTLVGLNYIHYAPPGAQVLYTNPLFVRTHDFVGVQGAHQTWKNTEVFGSGWPSSAGGRLVGSLSSLPYALAEAEQNFLIPSREQALIWGDLVPQMILCAKVPRWWNVTPAQTRWVALHMRYAESRIAEAALNPATRQALLDSFDRFAPPARVYRISQYLESGAVGDALDHIMPAELFLVGTDLAANAPAAHDPALEEARRLAAEVPSEVTPAAISEAFGTPKPTLANSYHPELLNLRTFPTLMGYSSRVMAESWESNMLFFAALSHDVNLLPSQLNLMVPQWTQQTVEQIFATHLEDWPALLRSLRAVGENVRAQSRKTLAAEQKASLQ